MPSRQSSNDPSKFAGQQQIGGDSVGGGDIAGMACEWCDEAATESFEMLRKVPNARRGATTGTGQFIFACDAHHELAKEIAHAARKSHRR